MTSCTSDNSVLKYYVYYPNNYPNYSTCPLPAVILFHGGAYNECGDFNDEGVITMCQELAYRGFVCFDVNYRVGVLADAVDIVPGSNPPVNYTTAQQVLAIYRACQDARGAIRSIIQRQSDEGTGTINDPYRIDVNNLIIGGISAGSLIAMNAVYYQQQQMLDVIFGTSIKLAGTTNGVLGPMDADYYYGSPTIEYFSKIRCVFNMWGGMFIPKSNINSIGSFFSSDTYLPPIISFQGDLDDVFNIHQQGVYYSNTPLKQFDPTKESKCLIGSNKTFTPKQLNKDPDLYTIGASNIYNTFTGSSVFSELYVDCEMHHGLDCGGCPGDHDNPAKDKTCNACLFQSDFGTGLSTYADVYAYIAGREATFYQAIIGGKTGFINKTKFVECDNNRNKCTNTSDNTGTCADPPPCNND
ncbi:MAG: hypothetical protein ABJA35_16385 [Parafilimonas sp.]